MRALVLLAVAAALANAASITWTGIASDNQWTNHINWSPDQVPSFEDDVTIPSGVVLVTVATGVNSLVMGTQVSAPANLTLFNTFVVGAGGMTVQENGNLIINTGLDTVSGQVTIGGSLMFIDGVLSGAWTVANRAVANLGNANEKGLSACTFVSQGDLSLGGVLVLNMSSVFTLQSNTAANTNLIIMKGDMSTVSFDASAATFTYSVGTLTVQAPVTLGKFSLLSGNITLLDALTFVQPLNVPAGSYVNALGSAVLNASMGITGAGVVTIATAAASTSTLGSTSMTGTLNIRGGTAVFMAQSDVGMLNIVGGVAVFSATVYPKQINLITGSTAGMGMVNAAVIGVATTGFSLNSAVQANTTAAFVNSMLTFGTTGSFTIMAGAAAAVQGSLVLNGPPNVPGLTNNGAFGAEAGTVSSTNIDIRGSGTFYVATKLSVGTATFSQASVTLAAGATFMGSNTFLTVGKVQSRTGTMVNAAIGDYTFSCPAACQNVNTPNANAPTAPFSFSA